MDMKKGGVGGHKGEGEDDIKGRERTDMMGRELRLLYVRPLPPPSYLFSRYDGGGRGWT